MENYTKLSAVHSNQGLLASVGTYGYVPGVNHLFGLPQTLTTGGVEMDMESISVFTEEKNGKRDQKVNFLLQSGTLSSTLEYTVAQQMFVDDAHPSEAVSAVSALAKANAEGQRVYRITPANQTTIIPNIHHEPDVMQEIQSALSVGRHVITHTDAVSVPGWNGAGYIILDPETGDGAYRISNGTNGVFLIFLVFLGIIGLFISILLIAFFTAAATIGGAVVAFVALVPLYVVSLLALMEAALQGGAPLAIGIITVLGAFIPIIPAIVAGTITAAIVSAFLVGLFGFFAGLIAELLGKSNEQQNSMFIDRYEYYAWESKRIYLI